jgi:hypothetical protein
MASKAEILADVQRQLKSLRLPEDPNSKEYWRVWVKRMKAHAVRARIIHTLY